VAMLRGRKIEVAIVVLGVALAAGCSRSASLGGAASARADQQKAPFPEDTGSSLPEDHATAASQKPGKDVDANHAPPFTSPMSPSLPAGTLLTVRLQNSLSSLRVRAGEIFAAVVDEPVVIDGNILVGRGAGVSGRVESAQTSPPTRNSASLRLILDSITIKGKQWPLQTASLFARGAPRRNPQSAGCQWPWRGAVFGWSQHCSPQEGTPSHLPADPSGVFRRVKSIPALLTSSNTDRL